MKTKKLFQQYNDLPICHYSRITNLSMARTRELLVMVGKIKSYISAIRLYVYKSKELGFDTLLRAIELLLARLADWNIDLSRNCLLAGIENHIYVGLKKYTNDAESSANEIANCIKKKKYKSIEGLLQKSYTSILSMYDALNAVTKLREYWYVSQRQWLEDRSISYKKGWVYAVNNGAATRRVRNRIEQQPTAIRLGEMLNAV